MGRISERERQVLVMAARGLTDEHIASELGISVATVRGYWLRVRTKLGGSSRAELVGQWVGLLSKADSDRVAEAHQSQTRGNLDDFQRLLAEERCAIDDVFEDATLSQRSRISDIRQGSDQAMQDSRDANSNGAAGKKMRQDAS